jgi:CubicO group peptidase (beta-lactamase class C family)
MMTTVTALDAALAEEFAAWQVPHGGCLMIDAHGRTVVAGDPDEVLPWASVTKVAAALAVLDVVADGALDLDAPAGPAGSTVRHLLAHASGLAFDEERSLSAPGRRRVYSNVGIDTVVAAAVAAAGARDAASMLAARVFAPLGMTRTTLVGPAAHGAQGPLADLGLLAGELLVPTTLRPDVVEAIAQPAFPGLAGVLPGFGRQEPNDWGLGAEIRGRKSPHWLPASVPPDTFGHFGQSGSFLWIDRQDGIAGAALTGTAFGPWAAQAWPRTTERMLALWKSEGSGR